MRLALRLRTQFERQDSNLGSRVQSPEPYRLATLEMFKTLPLPVLHRASSVAADSGSPAGGKGLGAWRSCCYPSQGSTHHRTHSRRQALMGAKVPTSAPNALLFNGLAS